MYLNGQGYSPYGINNALPFDNYINVMERISNEFISNQLNEDTLSTILSTIISNDPRKNAFINYKTTAEPEAVAIPEANPFSPDLQDVDVVEPLPSVQDLETGELVSKRTFGVPTQPAVQPVAEVKEGVSELFSSNPELASIGTQEQYSQYLDTIFPDSQVKDIVYRGGEKEDNRLFQYFTKNSSEAYMYSKANITKGGNITERNPISAINKQAESYLDNKYGKGTYEILSLPDDWESLIYYSLDTSLVDIDYNLTEKGKKLFDELKEKNNKKKQLAKTLDKKDVELLNSINTVTNLYDSIKIESEDDLTKPYDDVDYQNNIGKYNKARKYIDNVLGVATIRQDVGKITANVINITNPYKDEIAQEDLTNDRDAYKSGHDGAFLMDGDHFLVKSNTNQIQELGSEQDIEGFKNFVQGKSTQPSTSTEDARTIYAKLGNKTKSENVILPSDLDENTTYTGKNFWNAIVPEARDLFDNKINRKTGKSELMIIAYRGNSKKSFLQNYKDGLTVGNPFDWQVETGTRDEKGIKSTKRFIHWMITGDNMGVTTATPEYRQAIINDIKSGKLKGSSILYYQEKNYATHATALDYLINKYNWEQPSTQPTGTTKNFNKKNLFTVTPQQGVRDEKAKAKASIATQFIGYGEGIVGKDGKRSSTQLYREQVGALANTGNYSSNDVIFVSVPGLRGDATIAKREQDKTIREAIKAVEAGATILTDNKSYIESSKYNTGEQRLYKNMEAKGYNYSEITVDGQVIGTWSKSTQKITGKLVGSKFSQEIEGKLEANKDQLIALLGQSMYSEKLKDVVYKELLQNSFDATKIAESKGLISKGKIDIVIDEKNRTISFKDNGIGMSPEIVQKAFFTIGGTYKGEGVDNKLKSGGLGLAKMAFIFGSERLILETVNNGIKTKVDATSQEIRSDNFKLNTESTSEANGTQVIVKIPEFYIDGKGENKEIDFPRYISSELSYSFLSNPLIGNLDITYEIKNRNESYRKEEKETLELGKVPENYKLFTKASTDFADMDIYIDFTNVTSKYGAEHKILSSGLYQFDKRFTKLGENEDIPLNIIVDIKPKVSTDNALYPFNNQRENFRPTVTQDISALNNYLGKLYKKIEIAMLKNSFNKIKNVQAINIDSIDQNIINANKEIVKSFEPTSIKDIILDTIQSTVNEDRQINISKGGYETRTEKVTSEQVSQEEEKSYGRSFKAEKELEDKVELDVDLDYNKPIIHNNTTMKLDSNSTKFLTEISSIMLNYKKAIIDFYGEDYSSNLKNQLWGVSIDKTYGGVNVNPSMINMLAINPFYNLPTNIKVDAVNYLAVAIDHLIIHELNHNFERNEGAGFTGRFLQTYAEIQSLPNYFELIGSLKKTIKNNLETIIQLNNEYKQSENVESGFEENRFTTGQTGSDKGTKTISKDDSQKYETAEGYDRKSNNEFGELLESILPKKPEVISSIPAENISTEDTSDVRREIQDDLNEFQRLVRSNNGTPPTTFKVGDYRTWIRNERGLYDLVDEESGDIYLRDYDMATGVQRELPETRTPVDEKLRADTIKRIKEGVKEYRLDTVLAILGYDVNEVISNLENAQTQEELSKLRTELFDKLC
jgi:hypothetical protein